MELTGWKRGDKAKIASFLGLSGGTFYDYVSKRRAVADIDRAESLVNACSALGYTTAVRDWMKPERPQNPLFG